MTDAVDGRPAPLSARLALAAGAASVALAALASPVGGGVGVVGLLVVAAGLSDARADAAAVGVVLLFVGVVVAGVAGGGALVLLGAAVAATLTWDLAEQAVTLGEQVGRGADTRRGELVHAGGSLAVGLAAGGLLLLVYRSVAGGFSPAALVVLLLAAVALAWGLRP
jgi:hypothetical protein